MNTILPGFLLLAAGTLLSGHASAHVDDAAHEHAATYGHGWLEGVPGHAEHLLVVLAVGGLVVLLVRMFGSSHKG